MSTGRGDVDAAVAGLRARWGAAAPGVIGALALAPASAPDDVDPDDVAPASDPRPDDRVVHTGFAALDAILGPGGLPRSASVAIRGDGSSGRTTLALRTAAEAQSAGSVVAWLDLSRSFDPVEAVARGVRLEWLVVITPASLDEGLSIAGSLLAGRSIDLLVLDLPGGRLARTDRPARVADRLHRLAALARRAETLLLILDAPSLGGMSGGALASAVAESTGIRLELARRSWVRLGRDVVGQRTEALVTHNRHGPPGRRATLRILYAEGGGRDACLARDALLLDTLDGITQPAAARVARASDAPVVAARPAAVPNEARSLHQPHMTDERGLVEVDPVLLVHGETVGPASADGPGDGACIRRTPIAPIAPIAPSMPPSTRPPIARSTMRRLHLFLPHLPLHLALARRSEPCPTGPLVLGGRPWDPGPVIDASPDARALGVRRGMPLGSAHRLVPEATFIDPDPVADRGAAEAAFEALERFSPSLAGSSDPLDVSFGLFEVGIDGLAPLWGAEPRLVERLGEAVVAVLPGAARPRTGIAGTHFAATIAAMAARPDAPILVPPGDDAAFLADRPAGLLTTDGDVRARLTRFGLRRIGAVAALPRSALIARFGEEGARLHARANGQETEPFRGRRATERLGLALPIEPPVEELEPLRFVLHRLVRALAGQLTGRGLAADRAVLALELDLAFAPPGTSPRIEIEQRFPEPTADPEAVERLLFARLEREPPPAAVARLDLELRGTTAAAGQQLPLFVPQAARTARLGWQLARLALTYGEDRVRRVVITDPEAPLPEGRWAWQAVGLDGDSAGGRQP